MNLTNNKILKSTLASALLIAALGATSVTNTSQANAADRKDVVTGIVGGAILGALVGNAIKNKRQEGEENEIHIIEEEPETPVIVYERRQRPIIVYDDEPTTRTITSYDAHVDWCYDNKRTYRESDNTYRKRGVGRVECRSPYLN